MVKRIFYILKTLFKRRGTRINSFAQIRECTIDSNTFVGFLAKMERSHIGKCTTIGSLAAVYDAKIGNFCSIARDCYIGGASHPLDWVSSSACFYLKENLTGLCYNEANYQWHTETVIGNDVWIGVKSIVKAGVTIGDGAVIGSGSVVTKDVGAYEIWGGGPAKFIRKRFDDETIEKLIETQWWDWDDKKLQEMGKYFSEVEKFIERISQ